MTGASPRSMTARFLPALLAMLVSASGCFLLYPKAGPVPGMPSAAAVTAAKAKWPTVSEASLASGRQLFVERCARCHESPDVKAVDQNEWPDIMKSMGKKSHLDDSQTQAVLSFVLAAQAEK